jgi:hypothetical protein
MAIAIDLWNDCIVSVRTVIMRSMDLYLSQDLDSRTILRLCCSLARTNDPKIQSELMNSPFEYQALRRQPA